MTEIKVGDHLYRVAIHPATHTFIMQDFEVIKEMPTLLDIRWINAPNPSAERIGRAFRPGDAGSRSGLGKRASSHRRRYLEDFSRTPTDAVAVVRKQLEREIRSARQTIEDNQKELVQLETDLPEASVREK